MSGLVAVAHLRKETARSVADRVAATMPHRGDAIVTCPDERIVLARLARSTSREREDVSCVATGRLDNAAELIASLRLPPSASVSELASAAYRARGVGGLQRLRGRFAVAIFDAATQRLVFARDPLGVEPLFYACTGELLVAASEPRAIAAEVFGTVRPNVDAVARFIWNEHGEDDDTLFDGVRAVPPGAVLVHVVGSGVVRCVAQWSPALGKTLRLGGTADYADAFRASLARAVAVRTAGSVGVLTSGGLDSTSIAWASAQQLPSLTLLTMSFPGCACDETRYTRELAVRLGAQSVEIDPEEQPTLLDPTRAATRDVYFYPTISSFESVFVDARQRGITRVLTGFGGDQVVARHLRADVAAELRAGHIVAALHAAYSPWWGLRGTSRALLRGAADVGLALVGRARYRTSPGPSWMTTRALRAVADAHVVLPAAPLTPEVEAWRAVLAPETRLSLVRLERLAAHVGLSVDHPYLDQELIELVLSFPTDVLSGRGSARRKPLHRLAFAGRLPERILARDDVTHFDDFVERLYGRWQQTHLRAIASANSMLAVAGIVEPTRLRSALESRQVPLFNIGALVAAESWLETVLGGRDERRSD